MIVDAALADMIERDLDGGEVARLAGAQSAAPEQLEQSNLRKFWSAACAAIDRIDNAAELASGAVEGRKADGRAEVSACGDGKLLHQCGAVLLDLARLVAEQPRDFTQHVDEGRLAVA